MSLGRHLLWSLALLSTLSGCGWQANVERMDRMPLLEALAEELYLPTYVELEFRAAELTASLATVASDPNDVTIEAAKADWSALMEILQFESAFRIGPSMDLRYDLYFWPTRPALIQEVLSGEAALTLEYIETKVAAAAKGMAAIEYLLFREPTVDVGRQLQEDARRGQLLVGLGEHLHRQSELILAEWQDEEGTFRRDFLSSGSGGTSFPSTQHALGAIANRWIVSLEEVKNQKLTRPLGLDGGGGPLPETVESPLSGRSIANARDQLIGAKAWLIGRGNVSDTADTENLVSYLTRLGNPNLGLRLVELLDQAILAVEEIPEPLSESVVTKPASVERAIEAIRAVVILAKTELVTTLGITLTFSDNDGDG